MCVLLYYGELSVASANICHQSRAWGEYGGGGLNMPSLRLNFLQFYNLTLVSQKIKLQCYNPTLADDGSNTNTDYPDHHTVLLLSETIRQSP